MKRILVLTFIMVLALSSFAWAASAKDTTGTASQDSFIISNESAGNLINELINAGYGNYNLYDALVAIRNDAGGTGSIITDAFLAALRSAPASSEIFTTQLRNFGSNGSGVAISTDGTAQVTDIQGRTYYQTAGTTTLSTDISGVGRGLFTYSNNPQTPLTSWDKTSSYGGGVFSVTTTYNAFAIGWSSPIVLDLSGTGKLDASGGKWLPHNGFVKGAKTAMFDIDGTGFESLVEWVGPQAGILLMPGETKDITGTSLFGNTAGYKDGYEKLASFDKNKDGKLTGDELKGFNVWVDANGDAKAAQSEIKSLQSLGITEISVTNKNYQSSFVQNGQQRYSWDWWPTYMAVEKTKVAVPVTK